MFYPAAPRLLPALVLSVFTLFGAAMVHAADMRVAPELSNSPPIAVKRHSVFDWRRELSFGRWRTTRPEKFKVDGWGFSEILPGLGPREDTRLDFDRATFMYDLHVAADATRPLARTRCLARGGSATHSQQRGRTTDETGITLPGYPRIDCEFTGGIAGKMSLRAEFASQRDQGIAIFGDRTWTLRSVNELARQRSGFPFARFGFEVSESDRPLAAVQTLGTGRLWLAADLTGVDQDALALLAAALTFYASVLDTHEW